MFKAKLRKIGNSQGIYIPNKYLGNYKIGDYIDINVITEDINSPPQLPNVITKEIKEPQRNWEWCKKHSTSKFNCKCQ